MTKINLEGKVQISLLSFNASKNYFISIPDLLEIQEDCKSVLMLEYYDLRFLTSVFTKRRQSKVESTIICIDTKMNY